MNTINFVSKILKNKDEIPEVTQLVSETLRIWARVASTFFATTMKMICLI